MAEHRLTDVELKGLLEMASLANLAQCHVSCYEVQSRGHFEQDEF